MTSPSPAARSLARRFDALRRTLAAMDRVRPGAGDPWRLAAVEALDALIADVSAVTGARETTPQSRPGARLRTRVRD